MSGLSCPWISGAYASSLGRSRSISKFPSRNHHFFNKEIDSGGFLVFSCCKSQAAESHHQDLKFVLHDALDDSGIDTTHARVAREGFYSQIQKLSEIERETSISINRRVDLGKAALYVAAEDDSLISHSSVPLPVDDFVARLDDLSMDYCSQYGSSFRSSPEDFLKCLDRYLYIDKGFQRMSRSNQTEQRALYLHSVLTHRTGSAPLLSLIYSEVLKMLRLWGLLNFDAEVFFPLDHHSYPRGYPKQKGKESDQSHIITAESLLVQILNDLKVAFWPFQHDRTRSPFLRAAEAANCSERAQNTRESALELASVKAAQHRLQRGVWTSVRFGDMRRALSACERLILVKTDPKEMRDYGVLLYHCGFYKESLWYLSLYHDTEPISEKNESNDSTDSTDEEDEAVQKLIFRINLILMEEGWSRPADNGSLLRNNTEPW